MCSNILLSLSMLQFDRYNAVRVTHFRMSSYSLSYLVRWFLLLTSREDSDSTTILFLSIRQSNNLSNSAFPNPQLFKHSLSMFYRYSNDGLITLFERLMSRAWLNPINWLSYYSHFNKFKSLRSILCLVWCAFLLTNFYKNSAYFYELKIIYKLLHLHRNIRLSNLNNYSSICAIFDSRTIFTGLIYVLLVIGYYYTCFL